MHFDALRYMSMENIVRKGEIACNKHFLLFSQCFLPYMALIFHFKCTYKCRWRFVSIWTSLKFCRLVMGKYMKKVFDPCFTDVINSGDIVLKKSDKVRVNLQEKEFKQMQDNDVYGGWSDGMKQVLFNLYSETTIRK